MKSLFGSYLGYWLLLLVSDEWIFLGHRLNDKVLVQITEFYFAHKSHFREKDLEDKVRYWIMATQRTNPKTLLNLKISQSLRNSCMDLLSQDMLNHLRSHPIHKNTRSTWVLVSVTHRYFFASLANVGYSCFFTLQPREFLSAYVLCQNDLDLDFSSRSEKRTSTEPCRASSLFETPN